MILLAVIGFLTGRPEFLDVGRLTGCSTLLVLSQC